MQTNNLDYPPPQLKDFTIEKRLGSGTYASVYLARKKVIFSLYCFYSKKFKFFIFQYSSQITMSSAL